MFRSLLILSLVVILANAENYEWGKQEQGDRLLAREMVKKSYIWFWRVEQDVMYNPFHFRSLSPNEVIELHTYDY